MMKADKPKPFMLGIERMRRSLFSRKRKALLDQSSAYEGVFIFGASETDRHSVFANYALYLSQQNIPVICITDSLDIIEGIRDTSSTTPTKSISIDAFIHDNQRALKKGVTLIQVDSSRSKPVDELSEKILQAIESLANNSFFEKAVIFMDIDEHRCSFDYMRLSLGIKVLKEGGKGIVIASYAPSRFGLVSDAFEHVVLFRIYDAVEEFSKYSIIDNGKRTDVVSILASDIRHMSLNTMHYYARSKSHILANLKYVS